MKLKNRYQSSNCLFNNSISLEIRRVIEPDCNWKINQISRWYSRIHYLSFSFFLRSNKFTKIRKLQKTETKNEISIETLISAPTRFIVAQIKNQWPQSLDFLWSVVSGSFFCGIQGWGFYVQSNKNVEFFIWSLNIPKKKT